MTRTRHFAIALGLATAALAPACTVAARGSMSTGGVAYEEPPAARVESHESRSGYVWIAGRWDWRGGQWQWVDGRWETERSGYAWTEGRWERRGSQWHWIEGEWTGGGSANVEVRDHRHHDDQGPEVRDHRDNVPPANTGMYPMSPPPAPRQETYGTKDGYVWVTGRWNWDNSNWAWLDGHWERQRANKQWVMGRWEMQGDHYVWIEGGWN